VEAKGSTVFLLRACNGELEIATLLSLMRRTPLMRLTCLSKVYPTT